MSHDNSLRNIGHKKEQILYILAGRSSSGHLSMNVGHIKPCRGSDCSSPACHCGRPGSNPCQPIRGLWWTNWLCDRSFLSTSVFPFLHYSTNAPKSLNNSHIWYRILWSLGNIKQNISLWGIDQHWTAILLDIYKLEKVFFKLVNMKYIR